MYSCERTSPDNTCHNCCNMSNNASVLIDLAYGMEILLSRPLNFENEFNQSLGQQNSDSLYFMDVKHKEIKTLILKYKISWKSIQRNWIVPYGQTWPNLIVTFRNPENVPNNGTIVYWIISLLIHPSLYRYTLNFATNVCVWLSLIYHSIRKARVHKYWVSGWPGD
jgi:hypothetical protein